MMGRKLALIIGNSEYDDSGLVQLKAPAADVVALAEALEATDIGEFDEVVSLLNKTVQAVRREIAHLFTRKKREDLLLLYFTGHGALDEQGLLHLAVKDTERDYLSATAIPASFITAEMNRSGSNRQVLILDCCYSGAFARGMKAVSGTSVNTRSAFEGEGYGRVVLTATDATQFAFEGSHPIGEAVNSVFTHYLIHGLQSGAADRDGDGLIEIEEWYQYVYEHILDETPSQSPCIWKFRQQGKIHIAKNPHATLRETIIVSEQERLHIAVPVKQEQTTLPDLLQEIRLRLGRISEIESPTDSLTDADSAEISVLLEQIGSMLSKLKRPVRLVYSHEMFVDRTAEIRLIINIANQLAAGDTKQNRVVILNAARGSGKSWLLNETAWILTHDKNSQIRSYYVDLAQVLVGCSKDPASDSTSAMSAILKSLLTLIHPYADLADKVSLSTLADLAMFLSDAISEFPSQVHVFLFDHLDECNRDLLDQLEDRCLSPLVVHPNVVLVLAEHGRGHIWKSPELRLTSSAMSLPPFDLALTEQQLQKQVPMVKSRAIEIYNASGGFPWANYLYAQVSTQAANPQNVVDMLLGASSPYRSNLEALCVLRAFDEVRIQWLFKEYFGSVPDLPMTYAASRTVRTQLLETNLIHWDGDGRGYVIDEAVRQILESSLMSRDLTLWCRLHSVAYHMYSEWATQFPRTRDAWLEEANYHATRLRTVGLAPDQCSNHT